MQSKKRKGLLLFGDKPQSVYLGSSNATNDHPVLIKEGNFYPLASIRLPLSVIFCSSKIA